MYFPKYWAKSVVDEREASGTQFSIPVWRWSDHSLDDAQQQANQAAAHLRNRIRSGEYLSNEYYGNRPVREEVIFEQKDKQGSVELVITRNAQGCLVLNSAHAMFVDVDIEEPTQTLFSRMVDIFFKPDVEPETPEEAAIKHIRGWVEEHSDRGVRVYRTRGGLRYLLTHKVYTPGDAESDQLLEQFNSDPQYRMLCTAQESFRARLTPKPKRIGMHQPPVRFPYLDKEDKQQLDQWEKNYKTVSSEWRTCEHVATFGNPTIHPKVQDVIDLHDQMTELHKDLPLA
ncbi:hypothetical protein [Alkalicoccobacillus gibsonii]|uniref:hypothetical protein n=1 Tax=Alkalicoccobacillus gibsonii TaxID=79881 RepID=UPI003511A7D9